jgi:SAM-dependent methyltransferase
MFKKTSINLVSAAVDEFMISPPDLREINDHNGEIVYVETLKNSYERTVNDILKLFHGHVAGKTFVELGAFLGIVSKALSIAGANITPCDIPEFFERRNVISYYEKLGLFPKSFNLRSYHLPFESSSIDCLIACEIFEHLNFNPLPVIAEVNRILKDDGVFYIAMPNGSYYLKRIKYLFTGKFPSFSISELFSQLDPNDNMVVGLHWREYSIDEILNLVEPIGFKSIAIHNISDRNTAGGLLKRILRSILPGGETIVAVFRKNANFQNNFFVSKDS